MHVAILVLLIVLALLLAFIVERLQRLLHRNPFEASPAIGFGNFAAGGLEEFRDTSWNGWLCEVEPDPKTPGAYRGVIVTDDSDTVGDDDENVRVHLIGVAGGDPPWLAVGQEVWAGFSLELPPGYDSSEDPVTVELHGPNGSGPAPLNLSPQRAGPWRIYIRGGAGPDDPHYTSQWIFGPNDGGALDSTRKQQDWAGGNHAVVVGEEVHFRFGWLLRADASGWFEAWARWGSMSDWRQIVPRKTGIPTAHYGSVCPYLSCYYPTGSGGRQAIIYRAGFLAPTREALVAVQDARLGFSNGLPPNPVAPTKVRCSIQSGDELQAGQVLPVTTEVSGTLPAAIVYLFDGTAYAAPDAAPWRGDLDLREVAAGEHTHGIVAYDAASDPIAGANFPSYPVTVTPAPTPPPDGNDEAKQLLDQSLVQLEEAGARIDSAEALTEQALQTLELS